MVDFKGKTVVCIASGPSLTPEDCERVRRSGFPTIAVNNTWEAAPFCDVVYASDYAWWREYGKKVTINAERWTDSPPAAEQFGLNLYSRYVPDRNSGLMAVMFCEWMGAAKVILLGFDCRAGLKLHHHPDHQRLSNPSPNRLRDFVIQFSRYAPTAKAEVVNCTRKSALKCFPYSSLEDELCLKPSLEEMLPRTNPNCAPLSAC